MSKNNIDKNLLKIWYKPQRNDINYIFNQIMIFLDDYNITLTISKQEFYDNFTEFLYSYNYLKTRY
jgi:hypothetical protein